MTLTNLDGTCWVEGCGTVDSPNIKVFSTCQRCTCYSCGEPRHSDVFCRGCR